MVELADTLDLSPNGISVRVQVPFPVPFASIIVGRSNSFMSFGDRSQQKRSHQNASVPQLVDDPASKSGGFSRVGSNPTTRTRKRKTCGSAVWFHITNIEKGLNERESRVAPETKTAPHNITLQTVLYIYH